MPELKRKRKLFLLDTTDEDSPMPTLLIKAYSIEEATRSLRDGMLADDDDSYYDSLVTHPGFSVTEIVSIRQLMKIIPKDGCALSSNTDF